MCGGDAINFLERTMNYKIYYFACGCSGFVFGKSIADVVCQPSFANSATLVAAFVLMVFVNSIKDWAHS